MPKTEKEIRWEIFRALLSYYGKIVTPEFLRKTSGFIPGIERIHPLIEGIYKPKWSDHALSIASMKVSPYADKLMYLPDGRWTIKYSAKKGGPDIAANQSLFNCMRNKEPIIVLEQLSYYIHRNPLRARMVKRLVDYRWSSYKAYVYGHKAPEWLVTKLILSQFKGKDKHKSYKEKVQRYAKQILGTYISL